MNLFKFLRRATLFGAALAGVLALDLPTAALAQERVGAVSTTFRLVGPNDKVVVSAFDDPKVRGVTCYVSQAATGGVGGALGLAEDPSRASIACRKTGPISLAPDLRKGPDGEIVFAERLSPLFKQLRVTRFLDERRNVLVYLIWSTKLVDGSPMNNVTAVAIE